MVIEGFSIPKRDKVNFLISADRKEGIPTRFLGAKHDLGLLRSFSRAFPYPSPKTISDSRLRKKEK